MKVDAEIRAEADGIPPYVLNGPERGVRQGKPKVDRPLPPLTPAEWLARDIPPTDWLLGNFLGTTSRAILAADTGLGKTMFALALGFAVALGRDFMHWQAHRPGRVLFVDGEMPAELIRDRIRAACGWFNVEPPTEGLLMLSRDDAEDMPPLDTEDGQKWLDAFMQRLGAAPDLVIFDNFMSLCGLSLMDEEGWQALKPYVLSLTRRRIGQLWLHHMGHDKTRGFGTKTREWHMDAVLVGERLSSAPNADVAFTLTFPKSRRRTPANRNDFDTVEIILEHGEWLSSRAEKPSGGGAKSLHGDAVLCLDALRRAIAKAGTKPPACDETANVELAVPLETWRSFLKQISTDKSPEATRKSFQRGTLRLQQRGDVKVWGDWAWLP